MEPKNWLPYLIPITARRHVVDQFVKHAVGAGVDYILVGGSLVGTDDTDRYIRQMKDQCDIPVVLFPGSLFQLSAAADALLFLSLVSGRNPDLLIGQHVVRPPSSRKWALRSCQPPIFSLTAAHPPPFPT